MIRARQSSTVCANMQCGIFLVDAVTSFEKMTQLCVTPITTALTGQREI